MAHNGSNNRQRGGGGFLSGLAGAIAEVVSSAGELLVDPELRRKGAQFIVQEASRGINEAQRGLEAGADALGRTIQQGAKARFGAGARQLQSVLRNIERQIQDFQRQQQQQDLQSELDHHHKLPVDIQIGGQVFEDMPQEMRSRLWYVLLERPDLAQQLLQKETPSRANSATPAAADASPSTAAPATNGGSSSSSDAQQPSQPSEPLPDPATHPAALAGNSSGSSNNSQGSAAAAAGPEATPAQVQSPESTSRHTADELPPVGSPFAAYSRSTSPAGVPAAAAATEGPGRSPSIPGYQARASGSVPDIDDVPLQAPTSAGADAAGVLLSPSTAADAAAADSAAGGAGAATTAGVPAASAAQAAAAADAAVPKAPSPWTSGHNVTSLEPPVSAPGSTAPGAAGAADCTGDDPFLATISSPVAPSPWDPPAPSAASAAAGEGDGWEMVSSVDVPPADKAEAEALETVRTLVESMAEDASLDGQRAAKQAIFQAMLEVPWVAGEGGGIPDSPTDGTQYAQLLEAGCGSIEEVISRDVPRTFPEHPLFNTPAGQQRLLRVLKAYAAADPEVGYCQGMAFAAGVLLMYLPEEPAFRLFQRLMGPEGPNLRRYYLPGLDHLKLELSCFELLLSSHHPQLHQHLLEAGLPALLYAAQWLMTTYSCPFPIHVAARVLDVLLQSDSDAVLPRLGLSVMEALSGRLLELQDFEELITHIKVKPLSWPLHTHRKVFAAALTATATDNELQAAATAARDEFARSGRLASFSNRYLAHQATAGGTTRLELAPGPMGPRSLAATEAAADVMAAAVAADGADASSPATAGSSSTTASASAGAAGSAEAEDGSSTGQQQQGQQLSCRPSSSSHDAVLVGHASSGMVVVDELDALEDLITDLDLLLPGGQETEGSQAGSETLGSPGGCAAAGEAQRQP